MPHHQVRAELGALLGDDADVASVRVVADHLRTAGRGGVPGQTDTRGYLLLASGEANKASLIMFFVG